jgi:hypothetical protein
MDVFNVVPICQGKTLMVRPAPAGR